MCSETRYSLMEKWASLTSPVVILSQQVDGEPHLDLVLPLDAVTSPEHFSKTSLGSTYRRSGTYSGPLSESHSTPAVSAISSSVIGRIENASQQRNILTSGRYSSSNRIRIR